MGARRLGGPASNFRNGRVKQMKHKCQVILLTLLFVYPMVLLGQGQGEERNMRPTSTQLVINGAEVDFDTAPCTNACGGTTLISGQNPPSDSDKQPK